MTYFIFLFLYPLFKKNQRAKKYEDTIKHSPTT